MHAGGVQLHSGGVQLGSFLAQSKRLVHTTPDWSSDTVLDLAQNQLEPVTTAFSPAKRVVRVCPVPIGVWQSTIGVWRSTIVVWQSATGFVQPKGARGRPAP